MLSQKVQLIIAAVIIAASAGAFIIVIQGIGDDNDPYATISTDGDSGIEQLTGSGDYYTDQFHTVTAKIKDGYYFDGWYDGDGKKLSTSESYTFLIEKDIDLNARTILGYPVDAYRMHGVKEVLIVGKDQTTNMVTLRAVMEPGYRFTGWYAIGGQFRSYAETYTTEEQFATITVAKSDSTEYDGDRPFSYHLNYQMKDDNIWWVITDWRTGEFVKSFYGVTSIDATIHPGKYDLRIIGKKTDDTPVDSTQTETVSGTVKKTFTWYFEGEWHSAVWTTDYSYYDGYQKTFIDRSPTTYSSRMQFIDYTSDTVSVFAEYLSEQSSGMTELQRANYVLAFVQQCITYQTDSDFCGEAEYWKFPYETLYDGRGDCEDTTILYCAIMKGMGYGSAMLLYLGEQYVGKGHAAAGLAMDSVPGGSYYEMGGKQYYYCETTNVGFKVGDSASGYNKATVYVVN